MRVDKKVNTFSLFLVFMFTLLALLNNIYGYLTGLVLVFILGIKNFKKVISIKSVLIFPYYVLVIYGLLITAIVPRNIKFEIMDFIRGALGVSNFLVFLVLGRLISLMYTPKKFFKNLCYFGIIYVVYVFYELFTSSLGQDQVLSNLSSARSVGNSTPLFLPFVLILVMYDKYLFKIFRKKEKLIYIILISVTILLTFSRTVYLCFFALISIFLLFSFNSKILVSSVRYILIYAFCFLLFIGIIPSSIRNELLIKLVNSLNEGSSQSNWNVMANVNTDWRGFENYSALNQYHTSIFFNKLFGNGLDSGIYVGSYAILLGLSTVYISYLHNSFFTVLIKMGSVGLIFYLLYFIVNSTFLIKKISQNILYILPVCLLVSLVISSLVVQGVVVAGHDCLNITLLGYLSNKKNYNEGNFL